MGRGKEIEPLRLDTDAGVQLQAVPDRSRRSIQELGLPGSVRALVQFARLGSLQGYLLGAAVRVTPSQPGQSLAQLVHIHAAVLVTVQLLEETTPALPPLGFARTPPHGSRPGGEGRPISGGLSGGFAAPPPPRDPAGPAQRPLPPQPPRCRTSSGTCRRR